MTKKSLEVAVQRCVLVWVASAGFLFLCFAASERDPAWLWALIIIAYIGFFLGGPAAIILFLLSCLYPKGPDVRS